MKLARADFGFFFQSEAKPLPVSFTLACIAFTCASLCNGSESDGSDGPFGIDVPFDLPLPPREDCGKRPRPLEPLELWFAREDDRPVCMVESGCRDREGAEEDGWLSVLELFCVSNRACFGPRVSSTLSAAAWLAARFCGGPMRDVKDLDDAVPSSCIKRGRLCLSRNEARRIRKYDKSALPNLYPSSCS